MIKKIKTEAAIEAEIDFCLSQFKLNRKKYTDCLSSYSTIKQENELSGWELEDWEREEFKDLIDDAAEALLDSALVLAVLKKCYPNLILKRGENMKIDNAAWNALISMFNTTKGDSKLSKALFEMWLKENYYAAAFKEGWLEACEHYAVDYDGYFDEDEGEYIADADW